MKPNRKTNKRSRNRNVVVFHRGHKVKVPNHPTEFCSQPWFPLTLRVNNPTGFVNKGALYNGIVAQLTGLSFGAAALNVRLLTIRVWGPIPTTNTPLVMRVYDVFDEVVGSSASDQMILEEVTDYADQVNRARVGYVYSTAQQQKALLLSAALEDKFIALGGAGAGSVMYVNLLWRPYPQVIPAFAGDLNYSADYDSDSSVEVVPQVREKHRYGHLGFPSPSPSSIQTTSNAPFHKK